MVDFILDSIGAAAGPRMALELTPGCSSSAIENSNIVGTISPI